jgi:hypothetical protein
MKRSDVAGPASTRIHADPHTAQLHARVKRLKTFFSRRSNLSVKFDSEISSMSFSVRASRRARGSRALAVDTAVVRRRPVIEHPGPSARVYAHPPAGVYAPAGACTHLHCVYAPSAVEDAYTHPHPRTSTCA